MLVAQRKPGPQRFEFQVRLTDDAACIGRLTLPFRVEAIQTDNGSEFQTAFH